MWYIGAAVGENQRERERERERECTERERERASERERREVEVRRVVRAIPAGVQPFWGDIPYRHFNITTGGVTISRLSQFLQRTIKYTGHLRPGDFERP